ncbi:MAG: hypothetical protein ACRERR_11630, partial [Moraxellaceae bacterium]
LRGALNSNITPNIMKPLLLTLIAPLLFACGPTYIYKPNGIPVIDCSDLSNPKQKVLNTSLSECMKRNIPLLQEIYRYELKDNNELQESFRTHVCLLPNGQAKVMPNIEPPKSQLEKFVRSYIELMEFPRSNSESCFVYPFKFSRQKEEA